MPDGPVGFGVGWSARVFVSRSSAGRFMVEFEAGFSFAARGCCRLSRLGQALRRQADEDDGQGIAGLRPILTPPAPM